MLCVLLRLCLIQVLISHDSFLGRFLLIDLFDVVLRIRQQHQPTLSLSTTRYAGLTLHNMSKMPPRPRPPGGDVDIGYKLEIGTTVTFIAASIVVGLRLVARTLYARLGWDDYAMLFATVCSP